MRRGPRGSPLFPYTTLFRSPRLSHLVWDDCRPYPEGEAMVLRRFWHPARGRTSCRLTLLEIKTAPNVRAANFIIRAARRAKLDRKSTRLNSSHTVISYAVFC